MRLEEETPTCLIDGGEAGALMRSIDWAATPLGRPQSWPAALSTTVGLLLHSKFPMFVAWGEQLVFLYNDAYAEILGDKHPRAMGKPFQEVWAEIWEDLLPIVDEAMAGRATYFEDLPLLMNRKGYNEQTWFTFSYSPVMEENGKVGGLFCACTETTDKVHAERHRVEENERLRQLFQQAPGMMAVMRGPEHVFELVNDAYIELVGQRPQVDLPVREALPELAGQGFFELLDGVYRRAEPFVGRAMPIRLRRGKDGMPEERFVDFVYQPIRDHMGKVAGIFLEGSDVTQAVRAHNALRESESRMRQLANTIPQLAWMANPDGGVHWYNDRWYEFTGSAPGDLQGWEWKEMFDPRDAELMTQRWRHSVASGELYEHTARLRSANGDYRTFFIRAAPLRDADGNIVQWFGTNTDVTELETAKEELTAANRRKDEFLAMLAHELRNPLAPISTAAELLKLAVLDQRRMRETSDIIARQVDHMTQLVDDLLDVSRVTRGIVYLHKEKLSLQSVLTEAVEQVQALIAAKRQNFSLSAPAHALFLEADRTRLIQVFSNLLNNASKYTPEQGRICLRVEAGSGRAEVVIEDNGIGMTPALLPHVFDLFTQAERSPDRAQGGLGLGLALVKSLVELHGGRVAAHSEGPGRGSRFAVTLPAADVQAPAANERATKPAQGNAEQALRLLIVDDNADAARTLGMLLEAAGHAVHVEHGAAGALAYAGSHAPQIIFLDIGLPEMDGYALARRLRAMPNTAKAVLAAVTGYGQEQDKAQALAAGFDRHFVKPVRLQPVLEMLAEYGRGGIR